MLVYGIQMLLAFVYGVEMLVALTVMNSFCIAAAVGITFGFWRLATLVSAEDATTADGPIPAVAESPADLNRQFAPHERLLYRVLAQALTLNALWTLLILCVPYQTIAAMGGFGNLLLAVCPLASIGSAKKEPGFHAFWYVWIPFIVAGLPMLLWFELAI